MLIWRVVVLIPAGRTDILHGRNHGRHQLMLNTEAPVHGARRRIVVLDAGQARWDTDEVPVAPVLMLVVRVREEHVRRSRLVGERRVQSGVVDVVALNALVEDANAAAENGLAASGQVIGKADARLPGEVAVLDVALRETIDAGFVNAVQIELLGSAAIRW